MIILYGPQMLVAVTYVPCQWNLSIEIPRWESEKLLTRALKVLDS